MSLEEAEKVKDPPPAMQTCPFCGKTFKRLKSHLPHCKLADANRDSNATEQAKKSPKPRTNKDLLTEAKKQQFKNEGDDNMEMTKKTLFINKKHKCLESSSPRTQRVMHKEKKNVKNDIQNSNVDQVHGNSNLIDKEGHRPGYSSTKGPPSLTILPSPEVATSLVQTGPVHVEITQSQTPALQALPGGSKCLKASEDNLILPNHKEDFKSAVKKTGRAGIKSPLYKEVSKVMEEGVQGKDLGSFGNGFKCSFSEKNIQKPEHQHFELPSEPCSSLLLSTMVSPTYRLHNQFPRHIEHAQLPAMSHQLQTCDSYAQSSKKSLEDQLDRTPANKSETFLPGRDVLSRNCPLGLQWIPELQSNYIQMKIVPEKINLISSDGRKGKFIAAGPVNSECKPTNHQPIPEIPLTLRRLMDVRIGELPSWLVLQSLSVKTIPELGLRAWNRYYNKYINVRKGGIGGLTMLLVGYCVLSYSWNYHHIRQDRWRKYH